jgi:superfamily II DNA or RNA helicase
MSTAGEAVGSPAKTYGSLTYEHPVKGATRGKWKLRGHANVITKAKRLFPRAEHHREGYVMLTDTAEVARDLAWILERWPMEVDPRSRARLRRQAAAHKKTESIVFEILSGRATPEPDELLVPARSIRHYQHAPSRIVWETGRLLCTDDIGLGKTFEGYLVLQHPDALPALFVTLTALPEQMLEELQASFPQLLGHVVTSGTPYDPSQRRGMKGRDPDVLIMSYSKLAGWADQLAGKVKTVIFDEMQELRRSGSNKYVAAGRIADEALFRCGLTATPVYNYADEIYNIVSVLAPDALGTPVEFAREWATDFKGRVRNPEAFGTYLADEGLMIGRTRQEVGMEIDEPIVIPYPVEIDEKVLDDLSDDAVALAELIVSRNARPSELWQASGDLDWKLRHATGVAKAPFVAAFVKFLLEREKNVLLAGWHRDVYDVWSEHLAEFNPVMYTGTESPRQKRESLRQILEGESRVMMMSLRSGAGLDGLQKACSVAVFGELDWSPGIHTQFIGRLARDGQECPVVAYFLVANTGSDPIVAETLNIKQLQSEPVRRPGVDVTSVFGNTGESGHDRVRRLALDLLRRRGVVVVEERTDSEVVGEQLAS